MPKSGFSSITVRDNIYDNLRDIWVRHEKRFNLHGVSSMSAFTTLLIRAGMVQTGIIKEDPDNPTLDIITSAALKKMLDSDYEKKLNKIYSLEEQP